MPAASCFWFITAPGRRWCAGSADGKVTFFSFRLLMELMAVGDSAQQREGIQLHQLPRCRWRNR